MKKLLLPILVLAVFAACKKTEDFSRQEYILVKNPQSGALETNPTIKYASGGSYTLYVSSNVNYTVSCTTGELDQEWVVVGQPRKGASDGYDEIPVTIKDQTNAPVRRSATITLSCPEIYLNNFVTLTQGYGARTGSDFSFLQYGSTDPLASTTGKLIGEWNETEQALGWTSTVAEGQPCAWCYGKNGYVKLGDDNCHGADLLTPYEANLYRDTVVLAYFDAVAHTSADGMKDNGSITVTVEGGGEFTDGTTTKTIKSVGNFDHEAADRGTAMWDNSYHFSEFIISTPDNMVSSNTRVRIMSGQFGMTANNRVYVNEFYLFKVDREFWGALPVELNWK